MMDEIVLRCEFVEYIPDELKDQTLYVSRKFGTVVHRCCCGCGKEVVTPLSRTGWRLIISGKSVSLYPSVGNWSSPCQSHYWIWNNKAVWAPTWSEDRIAHGRQMEERVKAKYYGETAEPLGEGAPNDQVPSSVWQRLKKWFCE